MCRINMISAVNLDGGGYKGQSEGSPIGHRTRFGEDHPEDKPALRAEGFMTVTRASVETQEPGTAKARKRFQFSKR